MPSVQSRYTSLQTAQHPSLPVKSPPSLPCSATGVAIGWKKGGPTLCPYCPGLTQAWENPRVSPALLQTEAWLSSSMGCLSWPWTVAVLDRSPLPVPAPIPWRTPMIWQGLGTPRSLLLLLSPSDLGVREAPELLWTKIKRGGGWGGDAAAQGAQTLFPPSSLHSPCWPEESSWWQLLHWGSGRIGDGGLSRVIIPLFQEFLLFAHPLAVPYCLGVGAGRWRLPTDCCLQDCLPPSAADSCSWSPQASRKKVVEGSRSRDPTACAATARSLWLEWARSGPGASPTLRSARERSRQCLPSFLASLTHKAPRHPEPWGNGSIGRCPSL